MNFQEADPQFRRESRQLVAETYSLFALGLYKDNGKENEDNCSIIGYTLGFRVRGHVLSMHKRKEHHEQGICSLRQGSLTWGTSRARILHL